MERESAFAAPMWSRFTIAAIMLADASPAAAQEAAQVPEASSLTLFALGVAGVLIGRSLSVRGKGRD